MEEQRQLAAQEATAMPDLSSQEQEAMHSLFDTYHLREESVRPDGNCLYAAVASQLSNITSQAVNCLILIPLNQQYDYKKLRSTAADYIKLNKEEFEPF